MPVKTNSALLLFIQIVILSCSSPGSSFDQFVNQNPSKAFDLLIKNGNVIDGTGKPSFAADILIANDKIVFIGKVDTSQINVQDIVDATGKMVTPGFIDMHSHGDPLATPDFKNFLAMGVTTISLGKDGFSPSYENIEEWMERVADTIPGVNIAMFVGHGTLRALTHVDYNPNPTDDDLEKMGELLKKQLDTGCFGMTTGLEYIPGMYATPNELEYLAKVVGGAGKLITSHVRNEDDDDIEASLNELLNLGEFAPVNVSHIKVVYGKGENRAVEILDKLDSARQAGIKVTADIYPYTASYTGISILFPDWAKAPNDYKQVVREKRKELSDFLINKVNSRNGPEATLIGTAPWAGQTLEEAASAANKSFQDFLIDDVGPSGASGAYFVMDEVLQNRLLTDSLVMICSDGSPTARHPRGYGTFAKIIETYVVQKKLFSIEEAVRKMTLLPAETMQMHDRGQLEAGKKADILVFDPKKIKANATYEDPFQLATGFDWVILNGKLTVKEGEIAEERYGEMLKQESKSVDSANS